ncbi:MAG: hypothetical protein KF708_03840 [Pirellulales bacterium]|nr:hypothetical protein [Pirellulales bacterium]
MMRSSPWFFHLGPIACLVLAFYVVGLLAIHLLQGSPWQVWGNELAHGAVPLLVVILPIYAFWRVVAYHPAWSQDYRDWLRNTPWTSEQPLPFGPAQPTWPELAALLVILFLAGLVEWSLFLSIWCAVTVVYVGTQALTATARGRYAWGYATWFTGFALPVVWTSPWFVLLVTVVMQAIGRGALAASLRELRAQTALTCEQLPFYRANRRNREVSLDGALLPLGPHLSEHRVKTRDAWLISVAVAWAYFAISLAAARNGNVVEDGFFRTFVVILAVGVIVVRLWRYVVTGLWPPISYRGRLATRQWLVPGYDRVFAAPLLVLGMLFVGIYLAPGTTVRDLMTLSGLVFALLLVGLGMGPGYREWMLTAPGRLSPMQPDGGDTRQIQ